MMPEELQRAQYVLQIATLKLAVHAIARLSEKDMLGGRALDSAVELKRAADALETLTFDPQDANDEPNDLASRLHTIALLLESRARGERPRS